MTVTSVKKDTEALTMNVTAEFNATPERIWQLWADPRQLERWWGPPGYPATFTSHDLRRGGRVAYHMTGPDGEQPRGWWEIDEADPPRRLVFRDGFADDEGKPNPDFPVTTVLVTIEDLGRGQTQMSIQSQYPDAQAMEQLLAMGMEQGLTAAVGQIDAILAEDAMTSTSVPSH